MEPHRRRKNYASALLHTIESFIGNRPTLYIKERECSVLGLFLYTEKGVSFLVFQQTHGARKMRYQKKMEISNCFIRLSYRVTFCLNGASFFCRCSVMHIDRRRWQANDSIDRNYKGMLVPSMMRKLLHADYTQQFNLPKESSAPSWLANWLVSYMAHEALEHG